MGRGRKKKGSGFWVVAAIAFALWWMMRDDGGTGSVNTNTPAPVIPTTDSFAAHFDSTWPPLADEAGVPVSENLTAANYYLVLDGSGSMQDSQCSGSVNKMQAAKNAVSHFGSQIPTDANLGLAVFDGNGLSQRTPLGQGDRTAFTQEVMKVKANSGTPLQNAIMLGYQALHRQAVAQLGYGEYHLVVITDGEANDGQDPTPAVNNILANTPIVLHTIGFCIGDRHSLNQPGRIDYRAADDPAALARGLTSVLAESPDFTVTDFQ
jgi:uncharacterized protein YegL